MTYYHPYVNGWLKFPFMLGVFPGKQQWKHCEWGSPISSNVYGPDGHWHPRFDTPKFSERNTQHVCPMIIMFSPQRIQAKQDTLPKTNIAPENRPSQKERIVFQPSIFRDYVIYVSFRECIHLTTAAQNKKKPPLLERQPDLRALDVDNSIIQTTLGTILVFSIDLIIPGRL